MVSMEMSQRNDDARKAPLEAGHNTQKILSLFLSLAIWNETLRRTTTMLFSDFHGGCRRSTPPNDGKIPAHKHPPGLLDLSTNLPVTFCVDSHNYNMKVLHACGASIARFVLYRSLTIILQHVRTALVWHFQHSHTVPWKPQ